MIILLVILANVVIADEDIKENTKEPVSLGAYFGPLDEFQPSAKIIAIYADGDVDFITMQSMVAEKKRPSHYIHQTRREQIGQLLEAAKKLAMKYDAPAYALANIEISTVYTSHEIIVETWGDLLAIQP